MKITEQTWQETKEILRHTLTKATYTQWLARAELLPSLNGRLRIGVPNKATAEWCTQRLMQPVRRAIAQATGTGTDGTDIVFEVISGSTGGTRVAKQSAASAEPETIPTFDFLPVWRKTGYSQLPHYVTQFWVPYLKPAVFATWNALAARDTRPLHHQENRWTPPKEYSYRQLARHIGAGSHKTISGRKDECGISRARRQNGSRITETCTPCLHHIHELTAGGIDGINRCKYWRPGTLEILYTEHMLVLEAHIPSGDTLPVFTVSVYRVLPILTPAQVAHLPAGTRREHLRWLRRYEKTTRLTVEKWQSIDNDTLVPRQSGYTPEPLTGYYQFNRILAEMHPDSMHEST